MELKPKIKVSGLECNRCLLEGVPFVNNMVIEEPDYGIFFTDVFGNQAFKRWNDIHKVGVNSLDAIFDKNRLSSVPRPSQRFLINGTEDIGGSMFPKEDIKGIVVQQPKPELRKSKRNRTPKNFGPEFQLYLIEETVYEVFDQHSYYFNVEDDPKKFNEAIKSQDVAFWKEAINDEMDSIMGNNTWVLTDLPLVARIITIRLLIALALIRNLIIHQMDVKTTFLYDELDYVAYMSQPRGFIMPGNENKVCKLIKSLYGLKQAPKQRHQKFDEVVLSNGYLLNQADKCVYSKFDESVHVDLTKEFLSSRFSMKDMGEADVILVSTPMDRSKKLRPNNGQAVSQLEYSKVIDCLMYAINYTRHAIAFAVEKLSSAKTTAWNEFSSTMASAIICLATNQKFNFSKYIFESMVKNLDNASKFLMYLRFVQVFLDKQLEGMQSHKRIYVTPSHTKKIFRNMIRVGKSFSGRDTTVLPTMSPTYNVADEAVNEEMDDSLERAATTTTSLDEVLLICTTKRDG
ncbi:zinc finger, CCHC-type containing protein [Tanacetum coccineum]